MKVKHRTVLDAKWPKELRLIPQQEEYCDLEEGDVIYVPEQRIVVTEPFMSHILKRDLEKIGAKFESHTPDFVPGCVFLVPGRNRSWSWRMLTETRWEHSLHPGFALCQYDLHRVYGLNSEEFRERVEWPEGAGPRALGTWHVPKQRLEVKDVKWHGDDTAHPYYVLDGEAGAVELYRLSVNELRPHTAMSWDAPDWTGFEKASYGDGFQFVYRGPKGKGGSVLIQWRGPIVGWHCVVDKIGEDPHRYPVESEEAACLGQSDLTRALANRQAAMRLYGRDE
jgi:hypothetical protein